MSTQITETTATVIIESAVATTVEVVSAGPQGPPAPVAQFADIPDIDTGSAVDKSVLYYDASSSTWRGDAIHTVITLTDGGAF